jgi:hypothetical protein
MAKITVITRGNTMRLIQLDVPAPKVVAGDDVITILSDKDFVAAFPLDVVESVIADEYQAGAEGS